GRRAWELSGAPGRRRARSPGPRPASGVTAVAVLAVEAWSLGGPWRLACTRSAGAGLGLVEPVAARYRATLALNLGVMALAVLLGLVAVQQARRRERLEAAAHEEALVRDLERRLLPAARLTPAGPLPPGAGPGGHTP